MASARNTNWDPLLIISQIAALQALHYLVLAALVPPLLSVFAEPGALAYEGGANNVGMVMDWREMAGRPTVRGLRGTQRWDTLTGVWAGGRQIGHTDLSPDAWDGRVDPMRGWVIAACWLAAFGADTYLIYMIVRRPRMVLDHALTLILNHLIFTTYYSASIPTSLFFWLVMLGGAIIMVPTAEQACVQREMREGLAVVRPPREEDIELEGLVGRED